MEEGGGGLGSRQAGVSCRAGEKREGERTLAMPSARSQEGQQQVLAVKVEPDGGIVVLWKGGWGKPSVCV